MEEALNEVKEYISENTLGLHFSCYTLLPTDSLNMKQPLRARLVQQHVSAKHSALSRP